MKKLLLIIAILLTFNPIIYAQQLITLKGKVFDRNQLPLTGATVTILNQSSAQTDSTGSFNLNIKPGSYWITVSYLGYFDQKKLLQADEHTQPISFTLEANPMQLQEVEISTGYQKIPKERATGSFEFVNQQALEKIVSTNVIDRLQHMVAGLVFNKDASVANGNSAISIRGQNTIFANTKPLIVIDNFPYDGDLGNLNPNDVESISILKDAAAASIWGARAGNGVIVVTTKKGKYNQDLRINFNSNLTAMNRPDQFYQSRMSSVDAIDIEKQLFEKGFYRSKELSIANTVLSPIVELLIAKRDGKLTQDQADAEISKYALLDNRSDINTYLYRRGINKQYSLSLNGGTAFSNFFVSAGYDQNASSLKGNDYDRITLNLNHNYSLFKGKLELNTAFVFNRSHTQTNNPGALLTLDNFPLPYLMLADPLGNPLSIPRYRQSFADLSYAKGLLNWNYTPLQELEIANDQTLQTDYRLSTGLRYKVNSFLNLHVNYQYGNTNTDRNNTQVQDTYYVRNQINRLTVINSDGTFIRPIPLGGILDRTENMGQNHNLRSQLNFTKDWSRHSLHALAGFELREQINEGITSRLYGYDEEHASSKIVDYVSSNFPLYNSPGATGSITNIDGKSYQIDRYRSWFGNFSYAYLKRYLFTGSARLDQSNLFGVTANQKGVPLYAIGAGWTISEEPFYKVKGLPELKARVTFGYNGNIDKTLSAYTTARYLSPAPSTNLPYATVLNPPNPSLRWERVQIINAGLDFATSGKRISGSLEFYSKKGIDLIGQAPFAPVTGILSFKGNTASTAGKGIDITLNTINIQRKISWYSTFLFSYGNDKVTKYLLKSTTALTQIPIVGKPLFNVYAFKWAGLDPQTGDPQGYLNGVVTKDYASLMTNATTDEMVYMGGLRPKYFGAFRNSISYAGFQLSANISYRLGYVFRRNSIRYFANLIGTIDNGLYSGHGDYALRWKKPGDEALTNVPSVSTTASLNRDNFYANSTVLVEKGDHIRFEDITLNYDLKSIKKLRKPFNTISFYMYAKNLGIIWKATKVDLDPDYSTATFVPVKTFAGGLRMTF